MTDKRKSFARRLSSKLIGSSKNAGGKEDLNLAHLPFLVDPILGPKIGPILAEALESIPDDSLIKLTRQLKFWYGRRSKEAAKKKKEVSDGDGGEEEKEAGAKTEEQNETTKGEGGGEEEDNGDEGQAAERPNETSMSMSDDDFVDLTRRLIHAASWRSRQSKEEEKEGGEKEEGNGEANEDAEKNKGVGRWTVPKVRFGRTELMMPIVTCGGMRVQQTWLPDFVPFLAPSKKSVLAGDSQRNLKDVVRECLRVGLNHFETARFYGTSEMQFVDALGSLMERKEIKREDFIFQTKIPAMEKRADFETKWGQSWAHIGERLKYVDLLSFHCVSKADEVKHVLDESESGCYAVAQKLKTEGKVRHIGFSTHGTAENIMELIKSDKFDYVNIHCHYFGDYHAEGTPDTAGGHGNAACVKKALDLDMGVFLISPFDKGGRLYQPSVAAAEAIGPGLTPIAFSALHAWKTKGIHTVSVGFARPSDLDEVLEAARIYGEDGGEVALREAERRLGDLAVTKLGKDWAEKGMISIPSCFDRKCDGVAVGHILWLHNLMATYGMYDFCKERFKSLEGTSTKWNNKKTWEENIEKV